MEFAKDMDFMLYIFLAVIGVCGISMGKSSEKEFSYFPFLSSIAADRLK